MRLIPSYQMDVFGFVSCPLNLYIIVYGRVFSPQVEFCRELLQRGLSL